MAKRKRRAVAFKAKVALEALKALIDRQFMETPFFEVRQMTRHLRNGGHAVNPKRARRLMRLLGPLPL
ncbi:MAG: hypothetical protein Kilf2KO_45010 [Rhodospirillales bacterium]